MKLLTIISLLVFSFLFLIKKINKKRSTKNNKIKSKYQETENIVHRIYNNSEIYSYSIVTLLEDYPRSGYDSEKIKLILLELTTKDIDIYFPSFIDTYVAGKEEIENALSKINRKFTANTKDKIYFEKLIKIFDESFWENFRVVKDCLENSQDINDLVLENQLKELDEKIETDEEYYSKNVKKFT